MKINNIGGLSSAELRSEILNGGMIVRYSFTISLLVTTLQRKSSARLIRPGENAVAKGFWFNILSALFGWWGIPDGPKQTMKSIRSNLNGGRNITEEVMAVLDGYALYREVQNEKI